MTEFLLSKFLYPNTELRKLHPALGWGRWERKKTKQRLPFSPLDDMILDPVVSCSFNSYVAKLKIENQFSLLLLMLRTISLSIWKDTFSKTAWSKRLSNMRKTTLTLNITWGWISFLSSLLHFKCFTDSALDIIKRSHIPTQTPNIVFCNIAYNFAF